MPTGKVKWYDSEKGFGFLTTDDGGDVFVRSDSLPPASQRSRTAPGWSSGWFRAVRGTRRSSSACWSRRPPWRRTLRKKPEDMVNIVEDLMKLLEGLEQTYRGTPCGRAMRHRGRNPGRNQNNHRSRGGAFLRLDEDYLEDLGY